MTQGEYNAVFVTWAVLASTMIISTDIGVVSRVHPECLALLGNRRILNVNQDPAAHAPFVVFSRPPGRGATEQVNTHTAFLIHVQVHPVVWEVCVCVVTSTEPSCVGV